MATIKDVAHDVGVSVTTVSRALNGHDDVSAETTQRVREAAARLDYHPNVVARSLQNQRADSIGLMVPRVLHRSYDAFWLEFIGGMATTCADAGIDLVLSASESRSEGTDSFSRLVQSKRVDGVVICDVLRSDPRIAFLQKQRFPFVAFGRTGGTLLYSYIDVDGAAGVSAAVDRLIIQGHRRIAYLGLDRAFGFSHFRLAGYREALAHRGIPIKEELICEGLTELSATHAIGQLLDCPGRPTAVFASADFLALAVLRVARRLALSVPQDLSVIVFDDNPVAQNTDPPLTTVSQPNRRIGEEVAGLLLDQLSAADAPVVQRLIIPSIIERESTTVAPQNDVVVEVG